jgi:hypothetical protein
MPLFPMSGMNKEALDDLSLCICESSKEKDGSRLITLLELTFSNKPEVVSQKSDL